MITILLVIYLLGYLICVFDMMSVFYMHTVTTWDTIMSAFAALVLALLWPLYVFDYISSYIRR